MNYATDLDVKNTPCTEPVYGKDMIAGRGGGFGFQIDDWKRLDRFLILGHEGGSYYAAQKTLTFETVDCIDRCLSEDHVRTVETICQISESGRAPKNDPAIFALAYVASKRGTPGAALALLNLRRVCRIGTHLFDFLNALKALGRGFGRSVTRAIADWYLDRPADRLAMQVTKYAQRNGWSHRDVLRKCHAHTMDPVVNNVLKYVTQHKAWTNADYAGNGQVDVFLEAVDEAKNDATTNKRRVELIHEFGLVREHLSTDALNDVAVWDALLQTMPLTAMIRNLGKMSNIGLIKPLSKASKKVCEALQDRDDLKAQRVHPVALLIALRTYGLGHGVRGKLTWNPDQQVQAALDSAFYQAFDLVESTGKNFLLGVDVSSSMSWGGCAGADVLTPCEAAAVMAMLAARTEPNTYIRGFANDFRDLGITATDSLLSACQKSQLQNFGSTNVALPMEYALKNKLDVDVFCVYTDSETNCGRHPHQALRDYRDTVNPNAKLAVFGLEQTNFSVAEQDDPGQMDFVGFDAASPVLLADFAR
jgi:60 kDa SS-A/Ro ribonucleoprotein